MSTQAQITANQANAQQSTGPKTVWGKAASCRNNFQHGFTGRFTVLKWEIQDNFEDLLMNLVAEHLPTSVTENLLVEKMAQSWWLRQRAEYMQMMCFYSESPIVKPEREKDLPLYIRYQTTHDRAFHKALNDLLKLRAEKRKQEIGFESQQAKQALAAHRQANENRKQERHQWVVLLDQAKVDNQVLQNMNLPGSADRVGAGIERIIAAEKAA